MRRLLGLLAVVAAAGVVVAQPPPEGEEDPGVVPAQFTEPIPAPNRTPAFGLPQQPPTPVVSVQVLAPRDATDGKDIEYTVRVVNQSAGRANYVRVRVPFPEGASELLSPEPKATAAAPGSKDLVWDLGTMDANSTQTLTFKVRPAPNKSELRVRAYVRFEHGQQVVTKLSAPKLTLKAEAAKTASADAPVPVRLTVVNNGRVPAADAKLTVTISEGFEFTKDDGGEPTRGVANQRVWDLGTLQPGAVRTHTLRITPKAGRDLTVTAVANSANTAQDKADVSVKVLESGLKLILDGDAKAADGVAKFSATVRNTGGMPLTNVRVVGSIPDDCRLVKKTDGGRQTPTAVEWVVPRLPAGEEYQVRWSMECVGGSGKRVVKATASAGTLEDKGVIDTVFEGSPNLSWKQTFDKAVIAADQQTLLTVTVTNAGSEPARDVRLTIDLPAGVSDIQQTPQAKRDGRRLTFPPETVAAGKAREFTLTVRGETAGPAYFEMQLAAEALGGTPLTARKAIEVTGRR